MNDAASLGQPRHQLARLDLLELLAVTMVAIAIRLGFWHRDVHPALVAGLVVLASGSTFAALHSLRHERHESQGAPPLPLLLTRAGALRPGVLITAVGCPLGLMALAQLGWMAVVVLRSGEAMYGEAIIYDHAGRILRGEPLYQPIDGPPYTVAAYTPLYYWLAAEARSLLGDGFGPGRVLSCIAGLASACLVGYLVTQQTGRRWAGLFAAVLFLSLGLATTVPWSALYKEDALGVALSLGSIAVLSSESHTRWRLIIAGLLGGLAVLTKPSYFSAALAGMAWLWLRDRQGAVLFAGVSGALVLGTAAVFEASTGSFLANTVIANLNPLSWEALVSNLDLLAQYQLAPTAAAGVYALSRVRIHPTSRGDLLVVYWLASALPLVGLAKIGSNYNYWIEFAASTAVLATRGIWSGLAEKQSGPAGHWSGVVPALLLTAGLVMVAPRLDPAVLAELRAVRSQADGSREFAQLLELVREQSGQVLAQPLDVVVLAGRPILFEPYVFSVLERQGKWDPAPLVGRICSGEVTLLVLQSGLLERGDEGYQGYPFWPAPVSTALRQVMTLDRQLAGRDIFVRRGQCAASLTWESPRGLVLAAPKAYHRQTPRRQYGEAVRRECDVNAERRGRWGGPGDNA